jgi:hypothetical protein
MNAQRAIQIVTLAYLQVGGSSRGWTQAPGHPAVKTPSASRVIQGYARDTTASTTASANAGVVLRYRDPRARVITVSIRKMMGSAGRWSAAEEADSVLSVEDAYFSAVTAAQTGPCQIAFADKDSVPVAGGMIRGRAMAHACLVGDSSVVRLLYTYPVRDEVVVFQSTEGNALWKTSRFEWFVHQFVQTMNADSADLVTRSGR